MAQTVDFDEFLTDQLGTLKSHILAFHARQSFQGKSVIGNPILSQESVQGNSVLEKNVSSCRSTPGTPKPRESGLKLSEGEHEAPVLSERDVDLELLCSSKEEGSGTSDTGSAEGESIESIILGRWETLYQGVVGRAGDEDSLPMQNWAVRPLWMDVSRGLSTAQVLNTDIFEMVRAEDGIMGVAIHSERFWGQNLVLHPHGRFAIVWMMLGMTALLWDLIVTPLRLFETGSFDAVMDMGTLVTFTYWCLDILVQTDTGYDNDGSVEMRPKMILRHYVKGWLFIDLMVIGVDVVIFFGDALFGYDTSNALQSWRATRAIRFVRFLRLLRIRKMVTAWHSLELHMRSDHVVEIVSILRGIMQILILNHYIACGWYALGLSALDSESWTDVLNFRAEENSFWEGYVYALHWSLVQFTPATTRVTARNANEFLYSVLTVLLALAVFSSFISGVTNSVSAIRSHREQVAKQQAIAKHYLNLKKCSQDVWIRILEFVRSTKSKKMMIERDVKLFTEVPESLMIRLHVELYLPTLANAPWLPAEARNVDTPLLSELCHLAMTDWRGTPKAPVFIEGARCNSVYVFTAGESQYSSPLLESNTNSDQLQKIHSRASQLAMFALNIQQGTWLSELSLWCEWNHLGVLSSRTGASFVVIDSAKFTLVAHHHGGPLFAYLRALGLLLLSTAEQRVSTDLPMDREDVAQKSKSVLGMTLKASRTSSIKSTLG